MEIGAIIERKFFCHVEMNSRSSILRNFTVQRIHYGFPFMPRTSSTLSLLATGSVITSLWLSGCASARLEYADAKHAATGFKTGQIAIVGVLQRSGIPQLSTSERKIVAADFERAIGKRRKKVDVIGPERVRSQIGNPKLQTGSGSNLLQRALSSRQITRLKEAGSTYALLIEVCENKTWCDVDESCDTDTEEIRDKEGNVIHCITTTTYTTSSEAHRKITARYSLYELASGKNVWAVSSNHRELHSRSRSSDCHYPPPPPFPSSPTAADVMKNMSSAAIRKLPRR